MDDQERDRYLATLATTPARLKEALAAVPKKLLLWTPASASLSRAGVAASVPRCRSRSCSSMGDLQSGFLDCGGF